MYWDSFCARLDEVLESYLPLFLVGDLFQCYMLMIVMERQFNATYV